jgi:phage terminase large subunit-like protein
VKIDKITKRWIRNEADEKAALNGCRMDEKRGQFVVDWAKDNLVLWEGECAGQPLIATDWQYDCTIRLFGWVKFSPRWKRDIRRFREALVGKPKKNKKSPTVAWWDLYLLDGDGEPGQNVYTAAKDGQQARIVQGHAIKMVQASPTLASYMRINKTDHSITVDETNSAMRILSSDNVASQKAKEGLNGSCSVDEIHVVDEAFMKRISRMGISRSEPMIIQVTTAGDDPTSYGKQRYDYGQRVNSGSFENESFFFDWHEAPPLLTDEELKADPIRWGKMANPAWGHTIGEEEFISDLQSCDTPSSLRTFKMYRLNIWQQSSNPFLQSHDWKACEDQTTWDQLAEMPCWAGLDLSRTRDLSSLCLCFKESEEKLHFRWWFWMPEETAKTRVSVAPFLDWQHDEKAQLTLTDGDWIDYDYIWSRLCEIQQRFQIQKLLYDKRFADYLIQRVIVGDQNSDGSWKHRPAEYIIEDCHQGPATMSEPIDEFEKLVMSHKMSHDGNPIASWQASNVVKGKNGLLQKPNGKDDVRTIDGMQAAVMALAGVEKGEASFAYATAGSGVILF